MEDKPKKYCDGIDCAFCSEKEPCIYKIANRLESELQHKEQECEELKGKLKYIRYENVHLKESATDEQMDFLALNNYIKTLEFQLDQLKVGNEEYNKLVDLYKAKEQECERLKHDNDYEVGALEKTIDNLTAENEENGKLKQRIIEIDRSYKNRQEELEQTLADIKEIAKDNFYYLDCDYRWILEKILQKISEVQNAR